MPQIEGLSICCERPESVRGSIEVFNKAREEKGPTLSSLSVFSLNES